MSFMQDIVSKFNQQADSHSKSQTLNPFSDQFKQSRSPSPRFSREEYGKPIAGSKTDLRGRKAKTHICREILELCTVIHDVGTYKAQKRIPNDDDDDDDIEDDGTIIVSFGELFQIYTKISDKVVGLLIAAKRRGFVYFDREILFQRRDDDVLIALLKPISEINKILKDDINQTNGVPVLLNTESKPAEEKKKSCKTKRSKSQTAGDDDPIAVGVVEVLAVNSDGDRVATESNSVIDVIDGPVVIGVPEGIVTEDVDRTTVNLDPDIRSNDETITVEPDMIERVAEVTKVTDYKVNSIGKDVEVLTEDLRNDADGGCNVMTPETNEDPVTGTTTVSSIDFAVDIGVPEGIVTEDVDRTTVNLDLDIRSNDETMTVEPDMIERVAEVTKVTDYKVNSIGKDVEVLTEDLRNDADGGCNVMTPETNEDPVTGTTTVSSIDFAVDIGVETTLNSN